MSDAQKVLTESHSMPEEGTEDRLAAARVTAIPGRPVGPEVVALHASPGPSRRAARPGVAQPTGSIVGMCMDGRHPVLDARYKIAWNDAAGGALEAWLPSIHGLSVREADRVLLTQPDNWPEPIIVGVIDGFHDRPTPERKAAANLELNRDECIRVVGVDGEQLIEVFQTDRGPTVKLLNKDVNLQVDGKLEFNADSIALHSDKEIEIVARHQVDMKGEQINLN